MNSGLPILAICYGQQTIAAQMGGAVEGGHHAEFGRAEVEVIEESALFAACGTGAARHQVWMSHGDRVTKLPAGFTVKARSANAPFAIASDEKRKTSRRQFHPEVAHTPDGAKLLANFVQKVAGLKSDWTMAAFRGEAVKAIRAQVGQGRVLCGLSGGVDSAVAAVLIHEAIGERVTCVFVDHGLLRMGEAEEVVRLFRDHYNIPLVHVQAQDLFIGALEGETDPETKRKTIGRLFIETFEAEAKKIARDGLGAGIPGPGHALSRRDRERELFRRPLGDHQEPPQCRRPARAHEHEAGRALARTFQG